MLPSTSNNQISQQFLTCNWTRLVSAKHWVSLEILIKYSRICALPWEAWTGLHLFLVVNWWGSWVQDSTTEHTSLCCVIAVGVVWIHNNNNNSCIALCKTKTGKAEVCTSLLYGLDLTKSSVHSEYLVNSWQCGWSFHFHWQYLALVNSFETYLKSEDYRMTSLIPTLKLFTKCSCLICNMFGHY